MSDLYLGIAIQLVLMGASFLLAWGLMRNASTRTCDVFAAVTVIGIAVYARWFWEHTFMARLLPFSNLIVVSNWFPLAAGFLAGLVWQRIRDTPEHLPGMSALGKFRGSPRRVASALLLAVAGASTLVAPLLGQPPLCENEWEGDLCFQTTGATCSAAAAATLLQYYGVYGSEGEMAELCLTRRGTNWKGLYRGLTLKAATVAHRVKVVEWGIGELIEQFSEPCILQCELKLDDDDTSGKYELDGWVRGQPHSLVLVEIRDEGFVVFDPSVGMELWDRDAIETLWHGQAMQIVSETGENRPVLAAE